MFCLKHKHVLCIICIKIFIVGILWKIEIEVQRKKCKIYDYLTGTCLFFQWVIADLKLLNSMHLEVM